MIVDSESDVFATLLEFSAAVFGNQDRLVVAAAVADLEPADLWNGSIARRLRIADNRVGLQLAAFERAGLLVRLPQLPGERRQYFRRQESSFWSFAIALCEECTEAFSV